MSLVEPKTLRRKDAVVLSGHQPVYLPGVIVFNKIAYSDVFMFVGHCQYVKKSWHARNRIRVGDRELWLSIPVETAGRFDQAINDAQIVDRLWRRKHLGTIRQAYQKAPFFAAYYPELEDALLSKHSGLGDLNICLIKIICKWLGIRTLIVDSRDYDIRGTKTDMLISMCEAVRATHYLSNEGSRSYVNEQQMADAGIQHCWQIFQHPIYAQPGKFIPNMSAIDLLFNMGPEASNIVAGCSTIIPGQTSGIRAAVND